MFISGPEALVFEYPSPKPVKSVDVIVPLMTWFSKIWDNIPVSTSASAAPSKNVVKAVSSGAKTVKGPTPDKTSTKFPSAAPNAATKFEKLVLFTAWSTIVGKVIT